MLISDTNKFIFIHIPKTAGTSIRSALQTFSLERPNSNLARVLKNFDLPRDYRNFRFNLHTTLQQAQNKLPEDVFGEYKKLAFVRNPFDRMVSNYAYKVHGTSLKKRKRNDNFEEFVTQCCRGRDLRQVDYLLNREGKIECDFIGRFETINEDYINIQRLLSIELPALAKKNASKREGAYREYYTDKTKDLVSEYYRQDIEEFGYQF